jgi:lipopolysaccharide/colanic/teichoic acid biosynthesis glycosyltransferase
MTNRFKDYSDKLMADLPPQEGWYLLKDFQILLNREKNRSSRNGLPLTYVVIQISNVDQNEVGFTDKDYFAFYKNLTSIITKNARNSDLKTLLSLDKVGLLLVDTSLEGAKAFVNKILEKISDFYRSQTRLSGDQYIKNIKISLNSLYIAGTERISENRSIQLRAGENPKDIPNDKRDLQQRIKLPAEGFQVLPGGNGSLSLPTTESAFEDILSGLKFDYPFFKRLFDIFGSVGALIIFMPLMLVIAGFIKLTSRGPVFFKQERIGYLGRPFIFRKFRTMMVDLDESIHMEYVTKLIQGKNQEINNGTDDQPLYKIKDDPRITPLGHILRKTSLDELPQFFNVLKGEMSLVGPRPPIPYEIVHYQNWHLRRVLDVKPGITGLWQVSGRSITTFNEMVRLDLRYAQYQSFSLDLWIILKTFAALFNMKGAL